MTTTENPASTEPKSWVVHATGIGYLVEDECDPGNWFHTGLIDAATPMDLETATRIAGSNPTGSPATVEGLPTSALL